MRKIILAVAGIIALLAFSLYATIGETGPIGWINAAQARVDGTYSRKVSAFVLLIGVCLIVMGVIHVIEFVQKLRGVPPSSKPAVAQGAVAFLEAPIPASAGWRVGLIVWAGFMALFWGGLLAWYAWDWHLRRIDVVSDYAPLALGRGVAPGRPDSGSHLALQGGALLLNHALVRRSQREGSYPDAIYVPVVTADWQQGDPAHFVAQFESESQLEELQRAAAGSDGPVLVRVDGDVAGATRPVFEQHGVPVADDAVMVTAVASQAGHPTQADPPFDWMHVQIIGGIVTLLFTVLPLAAGLGVKRQEWLKRRREARAAGKTA